LAGIESISLPVAGVLEKNADKTDVFSCCYDIKDFSALPHTQIMSRCAGAEREHSQTSSSSWPMEIFHTIDVMLSL